LLSFSIEFPGVHSSQYISLTLFIQFYSFLYLLLLNTHRPVNITRDFQFQSGSTLTFTTFNFGVPVYISNGVTFELNGYSFLLSGTFMLGVGSVYVFIFHFVVNIKWESKVFVDLHSFRFKIIASGSVLNVTSSVHIGGTVQGTSNSSLIVNNPGSNIFIDSSEYFLSIHCFFFDWKFSEFNSLWMCSCLSHKSHTGHYDNFQ
jgi:hypothetical protein